MDEQPDRIPSVRRGVPTLFLVRHGRTVLNAAGVLRGHEDVVLDDVGRAEVTRLGEVFAGVELGRIVASPLRRAVETGTAIGRHHGLSVETDDGLIDRDYGVGTGRARAELAKEFGGLDETPGVEPMAAFRVRVGDTFARLATRAGAAPTLLVGHDAVNAVVLRDLVAGAPGGVEQRTACWNQFELVGVEWQVVAVDQVPHGHQEVGR